jgi:putative hydrolase of the HAD superfamily
MPVRAVILDFYGTLAETRDWGPSWEDLVAELGYELPDDVRHRWWNDGIDGTEHDEHSQSRDHYVAWQQARVRGMLDECGVPAPDQDGLIARVREISGHRRITAYDEVAPVLGALRERDVTLAICSNWDWDLAEAVDAEREDRVRDRRDDLGGDSVGVEEPAHDLGLAVSPDAHEERRDLAVFRGIGSEGPGFFGHSRSVAGRYRVG